MSIELKIFLLALLLVQLYLIIRDTRKKHLTIKYTSLWVFLILIMAVVVMFPGLVFKLSELAGFEKTSNMIFLLGFFFLFYLSFILTTIISKQNEKINLLIEEVSMLKERVKSDEKKRG